MFGFDLLEEFNDKIVFVDDNTKVHNRYICDLEFPIMSRKDALNDGVTSFLICSKPFKEIMTRNLEEMETSKKIEISYLDDFCELDAINEN